MLKKKKKTVAKEKEKWNGCATGGGGGQGDDLKYIRKRTPCSVQFKEECNTRLGVCFLSFNDSFMRIIYSYFASRFIPCSCVQGVGWDVERWTRRITWDSSLLVSVSSPLVFFFFLNSQIIWITPYCRVYVRPNKQLTSCKGGGCTILTK